MKNLKLIYFTLLHAALAVSIGGYVLAFHGWNITYPETPIAQAEVASNDDGFVQQLAARMPKVRK